MDRSSIFDNVIILHFLHSGKNEAFMLANNFIEKENSFLEGKCWHLFVTSKCSKTALFVRAEQASDWLTQSHVTEYWLLIGQSRSEWWARD